MGPNNMKDKEIDVNPYSAKVLNPRAQSDIILYSVFAAFTRFIPCNSI